MEKGEVLFFYCFTIFARTKNEWMRWLKSTYFLDNIFYMLSSRFLRAFCILESLARHPTTNKRYTVPSTALYLDDKLR